LIKEMRLAWVESLEEANAFLERYLDTFNRRFMKEALDRTFSFCVDKAAQPLDKRRAVD
jgi:hypothetical protein